MVLQSQLNDFTHSLVVLYTLNSIPTHGFTLARDFVRTLAFVCFITGEVVHNTARLWVQTLARRAEKVLGEVAEVGIGAALCVEQTEVGIGAAQCVEQAQVVHEIVNAGEVL